MFINTTEGNKKGKAVWDRMVQREKSKGRSIYTGSVGPALKKARSAYMIAAAKALLTAKHKIKKLKNKKNNAKKKNN